MGTLEDETQQPVPDGTPEAPAFSSPSEPQPPLSFTTLLTSHATEPTLKDEPEDPIPAPIFNSQPVQMEHPESEESDLTFGSYTKHVTPSSPSHLGAEPVHGEESFPKVEEGEEDEPIHPSRTQPRRSSPTWATSPPLDGGDRPPSRDDTEIPDEDDDELQDDLGENIPTPPETQLGDPTPSTPPAPLVTAASDPLPKSPFRPLSDHRPPALSFDARLSQTYVSPTRHATTISPIKNVASPLKRMFARSPAQPLRRQPSPDEESSEEFTRGMTGVSREPLQVLNSLFQSNRSQPMQEDSLEATNEPSSSKSQGRQSSVEETFVDPPAEQLSNPALTSTSTPAYHSSATELVSPPQRGDTQPNEEEETPLNITPPRRRFANLSPSNDSSPFQHSLFSDIGESYGAARADDSQEHDFAATQLIRRDMTSTPEPVARPTPPPPRPPPAPRATSTIPAVPEHRRLTRRAKTSVSDGVQSGFLRRPTTPPPPFASTFIDAPGQAVTSAAPPGLPTIVSNGSVQPASPSTGAELESAPAQGDASSLPGPPPFRPRSARNSKSKTASPENGPGDVEADGVHSSADMHEISGESLELAPPPQRRSPIKYGRRGRRVPHEDAEAADEDSSGSSSSPEDPEDFTYKQPETVEPLPARSQKLLSKEPSRAKTAPRRSSSMKRSTSRPSDPRPISPANARPATGAAPPLRVGRGKRKVISPSPELSGSSSSSGPEDVEDYTYRPIAKTKSTTPLSATSSRRPKKKTKTSSSARTSRAASAQGASTRTPANANEPVPLAAAPAGPVRVLAFWSKTGEYYAGTVSGRNTRGFRVKFDDGYTASVPVEQMRVLQLKAAEPVHIGTNSPAEFRIRTDYDGSSDTVEVMDSKSKYTTVRVANVVVLADDIKERFDDRLVSRELLEDRFPLTRNASPSAGAGVFAGKTFLISSGDGKVSSDSVKKRIEQNGGKVEDKWDNLFKIRNNHFEFSGSLVPFLLQLGSAVVMSPKVMAALATGIPILSSRYVDDAISEGADWRSYLVSPGNSMYLSLPGSQMVDPQWGEGPWTPATARAIRRPLVGMSVTYVDPSPRFAQRDVVKVLIPFCLSAVGAEVIRATTIPKNPTTNYVLVEDRDKSVALTKTQRSSGLFVNVAWLKRCLILGKALPASLPTEVI